MVQYKIQNYILIHFTNISLKVNKFSSYREVVFFCETLLLLLLQFNAHWEFSTSCLTLITVALCQHFNHTFE